MDESMLSTAGKDVLVTVVKMTQRQKLKGDKGDWKEFLKVQDRQLGQSMSDPAKRSIHDLVTYLKTFSKVEDVKVISSMVRCLLLRKSVADAANLSGEPESPQQSLVRITLQHPDYLVNYSLARNNEEWSVTELRDIPKAVKSNSMVAVDCEMVLCEDNAEEVVQVCVVDQNLEVKLNELVNPNKAVADYRTEITGISPEDLEGVTCSLAHVQKKMKKLLRHGTILVGHSLNNDLRALKLDHARVIDTSYIFDTTARKKPSLNDLCKTVLGYDVREVGAPHNCLDDARAAMKLVLAKLKGESDGNIFHVNKDASCVPQVNKDVPESELSKLLLHGIPRSVPQEELQRIFPDFTFQVQPRVSVRKQTQKKYTAVAIFENPNSAQEAFESINSKVDKDTAGFPQKLVEFVLSTGMPTTVYVRKMVLDDVHDRSVVEKEEGLDQNASSNKRSAEQLNKADLKKPKADSSHCEHHVMEIESLKAELRQKNDEIASLQKILAAFARKQGL